MKVILALLMAVSLTACDDSSKKEEQERQARIERAKELDAQALKAPMTIHTAAKLEKTPVVCNYPKGWAQIGMSMEEILKCGWGKPDRINKTTTAYGTTQQWVYDIKIAGYLYFDTNGILTSMSH